MPSQFEVGARTHWSNLNDCTDTKCRRDRRANGAGRLHLQHAKIESIVVMNVFNFHRITSREI